MFALCFYYSLPEPLNACLFQKYFGISTLNQKLSVEEVNLTVELINSKRKGFARKTNSLIKVSGSLIASQV